jgi:hypothetical protein
MERSGINDRIARKYGGDPHRWVAFSCECADPTCGRVVALKRAAFEALRQQGKPVLAPAHQASPGFAAWSPGSLPPPDRAAEDGADLHA